MPCRCDGYEEPLERQIDKLTRMLCSQCKQLESLDYCNLFTDEIRQWWEKHKEADRRREEAEKKQAEMECQKKLTQYQKLKIELGL